MLADQIRTYALSLVYQAKESGEKTVTIKAADIHSALNLKNRFPAVCGAIDTNKFKELANVGQIQKLGPNQSSTVVWVIDIL